MTIQAPRINYVSKTATSITVEHTPPIVFALPSASFVKTVVYLKSNKGDNKQQTVVAAGNVTISSLDTDRIWNVFGIAVSNVGELSLPSDRVEVALTATDLETLAEYFIPPPLDDNDDTFTTALCTFLQAIGFLVHGAGIVSSKLVLGENLFADFYPHWYYDTDAAETVDPGATVVVLQGEPLDMPSRDQRFNHKVDAIVRVQVCNGQREKAAQDCERMYRYFLQRESGIEFNGCGLSVRLAQPMEVPSLVGVDDTQRSLYSFRMRVRAITL